MRGVLLVLAAALALAAPATAAYQATPGKFRNCKALNAKYPHGVGRVGARDRSKSGDPVTNFRRSIRKRGFLPALEEAKLDGKGITIHGLRSAAVSIYAAKGLTLAETADVMGQEDPLTTWKHYLKLFDRSKVSERIRAAQESVVT